MISFSLIAISVILAACSVLGQSNSPFSTGGPGRVTDASGFDASNGERIFFTGIDKNGNSISHTGGPNFGGMMKGNYLTCAACHGPDAHGGQHVMQMQTMDAPAIYSSALTSMMVEESGGTPQPEGYTLQNFQKAVVDGKHPDGNTMNANMPRWQMSDQDLGDLFAFLKTIQK